MPEWLSSMFGYQFKMCIRDRSVTGQHLVGTRRRSGTDELFTHAVGFLHQEYHNPCLLYTSRCV